MINLRNFNAAMEDFSMSDDADVSIEQTIEIEVAADEETQEAIEVEESIEESEDVTEETEQMLATLEYAAHAETVIEEFGWSRPVAAMLNRGQDIYSGTRGDLEAFLGITMPANESLDMVSSAYDDNTIAAMEGFKKAMEDFWTWIKKQAVKIKDFFVNLWNRIVTFFMGGLKASKRYAEQVGRANISTEKLADRKMKLVPYDSFSTASGLLSKLATVVDKATEAVVKLADNMQTGDADALAKARAYDLEAYAVFKQIFNDIKQNDDGSITVTKSDFVKKFEAKEDSISGNGWNKDAASKYDTVKKCTELADKIKANKGFIKVINGISKAQMKAKSITDENKEAVKEAKKGAKAVLKKLNGNQKALNLIGKFLSHVVRQYIRGQRAVLACRS